MTAEEIAQIVALCRVRAGLKVAPDKTYLMESRLAPVARREGYDSITDLIAGSASASSVTIIASE